MTIPHLIATVLVSAFLLSGGSFVCGALWHSNNSAAYHADRRATLALESIEMQRARVAQEQQPMTAGQPAIHVHLHGQTGVTSWAPAWRDMPFIDGLVINNTHARQET